MKTRMNKVRLLAGGMAAIITMSSMSTIAFAAEANEIPNEVQAEYVRTLEEKINADTIIGTTGNAEYGVMMQQANEATTEIEQTQPQEEKAVAEVDQTQPQEEKTTVEADQTQSQEEKAATETDQAQPQEEKAATETDQAQPQEEKTATEADQAQPQDNKGGEEAKEDSAKAQAMTQEELEDYVSKNMPANPEFRLKMSGKTYEGNIDYLYTAADGRCLKRTYNPDGSFSEKIYRPESKKTVPGSTEEKTIPAETISVTTRNADGTWEQVVYEGSNEISKKTYSDAEMIEKAKYEAEANNIKENATLEDFINGKIESSINTKGTEIFSGKSTEETGPVAKEKQDDGTALIGKACGSVVDGSLKLLPGSDFYAAPVKSIIMGALGIKSEYSDVVDQISKRIDISDKNIETLINTNTRLQPVVTAINSIGNNLDVFTSSCTQIATDMSSIIKQYKDKEGGEAKTIVEIASLLGTDEDRKAAKSGVFKDMFMAADGLRSKDGEGPQASIMSKNLYELFYDYYKEESMFSGEAMDKASDAIKTRVKQFASNCKFVMDVLKIQDAAVNLTAEQVATLDEDTKKQYDTLVKRKDGIKTAKMSIASIFTGDKDAKLEKCKYGIIGTLKDYASKNRRVYLEKTTDGFNEIKLCPGIATYNSEELDYKQLENKQDLSKEQICRLQDHVNAMGITMNDYLTQVGFDTSNLKQEGKTTYFSTGGKSPNYVTRTGTHGLIRQIIVSYSANGIDVNKQNAKEEEYKMKWHYNHKAKLNCEKGGVFAILKKARN
ncbi:hypothetical protein SAMN02910384_02746 [Pseudobutyrivibrio sp. ACV-2]|uniref:cell envelope integrity protein TolA n=1 Tax=Pseudobutyrivibrio sp. ACV-2 TaxID=1520801 RepID=UPI0008942487|nr:hypothetical protein [Pseudobutyrivibrio sp. ACV-2]SEA92691.1 hypothetical protein SAMN02910384_02746 [Pseudobutyrivibrio sp. ACV-2]